MIDSNVLKKVAEQANISDSYISARGEFTPVAAGVIEQLLADLGYDISSDDLLLASAEKKHKAELLEPVLVLHQDEALEIPLRVSIGSRASDFHWSLTTEQGNTFQGDVSEVIARDDREHTGTLILHLPVQLEMGYHQFTLTRKRRKAPYQMRLIIAPRACYKQPEIEQGKKLWGPSVQLYTLKTQHNWGMGDFGDLKQLVSDIASRGGDFVGLNPIHALFPANPEAASPYSPSSRRWLNILYIDVSSVPEFSLSATAQQVVGGPEFQSRLQKVRDTHWVNYTDVAELKMSVLPLLYDEFKQRHLSSNSERAQLFKQFVEEGGSSLLQQATFDALHAHLQNEQHNLWGWPAFPEQYRRYENSEVQQFAQEHQDKVQLYLYLQWVADTQIHEAQQLALQKGMTVGLYRDLAVGVADSGSETWSDNGNLVLQASVGAPPDILGPLGQNWGLPPLNPQKLQETGYELFIQLLRRNMQHCGALRIDHVMGLLRLWWIPRGESATNGAYMYYPVKDMLAILALESHRQQCSVIGEDLGTVPDEMADLLRDAGVHSYKVFFFETSKTDGGYISPKHYPIQSMATLCTHDMPTLRGFWHCEDLKLGGEIGLYPDKEQLQRLFDDRLRSKQGILDSVAGHGRLPEGIGHDAMYVPMDSYLSEALQLHVAAGSSALLSVQLEDWLEMDQPVNIPGTVDEYPNWRRKLSCNLEQMFAKEEVNRMAAHLSEIRQQVSRS
ncbi:4-alpha-glucanotransferase [Vibrio nitrifigilis]|uniref:4-alpha-glucanotransferase n=1 Tax=Vibrio nitrifigilis TaxID=2789781 RepID=A0ABS0GMH5_9VIBR|nr:4-alpha-glucanotransferase [Vibrio nitrifigilis]MBF9003439.1 4-alpha-glucanotransferase [Vibrio nitrifigilis]